MHKQRSQCKFQLHVGQCRSALEGVFGLSLAVLPNIAAAIAPDDAVDGLKNTAIYNVSWRNFLCGGRRLVIINFSASTVTNKT
jgi:hypothetical protein